MLLLTIKAYRCWFLLIFYYIFVALIEAYAYQYIPEDTRFLHFSPILESYSEKNAIIEIESYIEF